MSRKVFVGNLAYSTTRTELEQLFGSHGEVVDVHIPQNRDTGQPRGFAFVELSTEEEAKAAIEALDGAELGGRALRMDAAHDRPPRERSSGGGFRGGGGPRHHDDGGWGGDDGGHGGGDRGGRGGGDRGGWAGAGKRGKGSRRGLRGKKRSL